jgi:hypothetical protein
MQNERLDTELARKYGLSDEQIEAMQGMSPNLPRASIWRFRNKTPEQITRIVQNYAPAFIDYTRDFTGILGKPELLAKFNRDYAKLVVNAARMDLRIAIELDDEELLKRAMGDIRMIFHTSKDPDRQVEMLLSNMNSTQSSVPPPPHLDSNI